MLGRKAVFIVTPKESEDMTLKEAIYQNKDELIFAFVLTAISEYFHHSLLPVVLIVVPAILSIYLTMYSNKDLDNETIDTNPQFLQG